MANLFQLVRQRAESSTAIVGMTKNVGKTVTLNYLIACFAKAGLRLGLVSAGYDGERFDRLTLKDKPRIFVPAGAIVATAKACFDAAEAELELLASSSFATPLGLVLIGRVKKAGLVELAGPSSVQGLFELKAMMSGYDVDHVLVDGAINRLASASPQVTAMTILATGASLGMSMEDAIKKTLFRQALFASPAVDDPAMREAALLGLGKGDAVMLERDLNGYRPVAVESLIPLLAGAEIVKQCSDETAALVFGGALVDEALKVVLKRFRPLPTVIVGDATKVFLSPEIYYRYLGYGGQLLVLKPLDLVAITLNPTDPLGRGYDPATFLAAMEEALSPLPVFDLIFQAH